MFLFWCDSGSFLRRKQGLWLLLTITGRSFTKHWRGTPTPLVLLGVLGPMVKKIFANGYMQSIRKDLLQLNEKGKLCT
jgi:hypothetical protein